MYPEQPVAENLVRLYQFFLMQFPAYFNFKHHLIIALLPDITVIIQNKRRLNIWMRLYRLLNRLLQTLQIHALTQME